ncbi:MAG: YopX family protein [Vulcanibacillus sp.]
MPPIEFRAWDLNEGEYISWDRLITTRYNQDYNIDNNISDVVLSVLTDKYIILEQYTGVNDKNGKKSFYNDIAKTREGISLIKYWEGNAWLEGIDWLGLILLSDRNAEFEVIGNIRENSELRNTI